MTPPTTSISTIPISRGKRPRTMLIEEVEAIWAPIAESDDWSLLQKTLAEIAQMREAYGIYD